MTGIADVNQTGRTLAHPITQGAFMRPTRAARALAPVLDEDANPRAVVGANHPPEPTLVEPWKAPAPAEPTPFELAEKRVNDIYDETLLWLDGHVIDSQDLADGVGNLLAELRKAYVVAEQARTAEKAPLDAAIAEIQQRYAPLIADTKSMRGKTVLAAAACKEALAPWLIHVAQVNAAKAALERAEADRQRQAAEDAIRTTSGTADLAKRAAAEVLVRDARKAETAAVRAEKTTAKAGGAMGRSIALRSVWVATIADPLATVQHYWAVASAEMTAFVQGLADDDVRKGCRAIPGVTIVETKVAV